MTNNLWRIAAALAVVVVCGGSAAAAEWATLSGRFVYDGTPPAPVKLTINKDVEVCEKHAPVDESLVVGESGGLANVVIYVRTKGIAVHPDYAKSASEKITLDNHECRFQPHVVGLRAGQTLVLKNSDSVGHNSKVDAFANEAINVLIPPNAQNEHVFKQAETLPAKVGCNIHPWMSGWIVIRPDPYFAVSDKDGKFEIKNLPDGELEFQVWQEKAGYLQQVTIGGKSVSWPKGRFKHNAAASGDLGEIKVGPDVFKGK